MNTVLGHTRSAVLRFRGAVLLLLLIVGLQILVSLAGPWPLKLVVDNVLGDVLLPAFLSWLGPIFTSASDPVLLALLGVSFLALQGLQHLGQLARHYVMARIGALMRIDLASKLLRHLQEMDSSFYGKERLGDLTQRLTEDTRFTGDLVGLVLVPGLTSVGTLVAMLAVLTALAPALALTALVTALPVPFLILYFRTRITERSYEQQQSFGDLMAEAEQSITSVQIVQAFNREEEGERRFRSQASRAVRAVLRATWTQLSFDFALGFVRAFGLAAGMVIGAFMVLDGRITVGTLLVALTYLESVIGPVGALASIAASYGAASGKGRRVIEILETEPPVRDLPDAAPLASVHASQGRTIRFENVHFGYPDGPEVLKGVVLEVFAGETVALVGPTGVGKSTLASLLMRLFDPREGRILIDGRDLRETTLDSLRSNLAVVMQDPFLLPVSIAENIRLGKPDATPDEIRQAARIAQADDFISRLADGYDTVIGERGATLSGGQKQRIAIARAILRDAPVLILDEPSSSLDVETEAALFDALKVHRGGRTVLLIAHRPATLRIADRIMQLREGRLSETPRQGKVRGAADAAG